MHLARLAIIHAAEFRAVAERPVHRQRVEAEHAFEFVEQFEWRARGPIQLVHESEDRHAALAADFKEFQRLRLDALACVNDHHRGVHGGEHAVGVLGKILVTRRVEQVHHAAAVFKLQHGGRHGDAALLFQLHPIARRRALVLVCRHAACELHRAAVEQEFFCERGLARIGVRDDGEGATTRDFAHGLGGQGRFFRLDFGHVEGHGRPRKPAAALRVSEDAPALAPSATCTLQAASRSLHSRMR